MVDLIRLSTGALSPVEVLRIVNKMKLTENKKAGKVFYDNLNAKNVRDRFFLKIDTMGRLRLELSLHKYYNHLTGKGYVNADMFTFKQAEGVLLDLIYSMGLDGGGVRVVYYELGLNIYLGAPVVGYMELIKGIGLSDFGKEISPNMKYKNHTVKTTHFHKDIRKYFKVYDKCFEMKENKSPQPVPHPYILRIETVNKRPSKITVDEFLGKSNIGRLISQFKNDWRGIRFEGVLKSPIGTKSGRAEMAKKIIAKGRDWVTNDTKEAYKRGEISRKAYRTKIDFITKIWPMQSKFFAIQKTEKEVEFREVFEATILFVCS